MLFRSKIREPVSSHAACPWRESRECGYAWLLLSYGVERAVFFTLELVYLKWRVTRRSCRHFTIRMQSVPTRGTGMPHGSGRARQRLTGHLPERETVLPCRRMAAGDEASPGFRPLRVCGCAWPYLPVPGVDRCCECAFPTCCQPVGGQWYGAGLCRLQWRVRNGFSPFSVSHHNI